MWGRGEKCGAIGVAAVGKLKEVSLHQRMIRAAGKCRTSGGEGMSILAVGLGGESVQVWTWGDEEITQQVGQGRAEDRREVRTAGRDAGPQEL